MKCLRTSDSQVRLVEIPEDRVEGEVLPGSCRYLRRVLGTVVALLCLRHFLTLHRRSDFLSPLTSISVEPSFFRNFFSTYFAFIQASFSCLHGITTYDRRLETDIKKMHANDQIYVVELYFMNSYLELDDNGFFRPCSL